MALAIFGAAAMQGPIRWWAREHRAHHRFTDTSEDPYNIKKGFFHAHILWMVIRQPKRTRRVDISDLRNDPVVAWQERFYPILAVLMGWIFPMAFSGLGWNDWTGGLLYGGILRMFVCHQGVFCINSVAHYYGDQPYDDRLSPRNIPHVMALLTLGEGYHNFHHMFPSDYRNGVHWYDLDFTKWIIWVWGKLGLVQGLKRFRHTEIEKASLQKMQKELRKKESQLTWGPPLNELPVIDWKTLQAEVLTGRNLVVIEGIIHDVECFISEHPGGSSMIQSCIGKDASAMFNGGIYNHSIVARNVLSTMRVAVLLGGCEVETLEESVAVESH
jgi:stearoyl-CoA desaturase (delta-9 desaturase)